LLIAPGDDLLVALRDLPAGLAGETAGLRWLLRQDIPFKHKFALRPLAAGAFVRMYGLQVGIARRDIAAGEWISTENLAHATAPLQLRAAQQPWQAPDVSRWQGRHFLGFHRPGGQVGTANYWLVLPLVFCENRNLEVLRRAFHETLGYALPDRHTRQLRHLLGRYQAGARLESLLGEPLPEISDESLGSRPFPQVDGIKFLPHTGGCGGTREDSRRLCQLLAGYITHPNVAGATVLSLGCQHAQTEWLREAIAEADPHFAKPLYVLEQQKSRSEPAFMAEALRCTFAGVAAANELRREPAPLSKLTLGLECGGSDGLSGITANPLVGQVSDYLVALGGAAILSEFPELSGAEQWLVDRCVAESVAAEFIRLMRAYEAAAQRAGSGFEANPSPGNIRDGLITDAMKSAGAALKGGSSPVVSVLEYGGIARGAGLHLLCTPGNDVESTTGLAAAGAQIILFTTGLGTPTGNPVAQTLKISSNTPLFRRMGDLIDFDAGRLLGEPLGLAELGAELLEQVLATASGEYVPSAVRLQQDDFIPWKNGVSL
jgi:altronate hydrolase